MPIFVFIKSLLYSISQATFGLLVHPYQTMQSLVEEKVFLWLSFLPTVLGFTAALLWWIALKLLYLQIPFIGLWAFSILWLSLFFAFWQILLLYLLIRFWTTLR